MPWVSILSPYLISVSPALHAPAKLPTDLAGMNMQHCVGGSHSSEFLENVRSFLCRKGTRRRKIAVKSVGALRYVRANPALF